MWIRTSSSNRIVVVICLLAVCAFCITLFAFWFIYSICCFNANINVGLFAWFVPHFGWIIFSLFRFIISVGSFLRYIAGWLAEYILFFSPIFKIHLLSLKIFISWRHQFTLVGKKKMFAFQAGSLMWISKDFRHSEEMKKAISIINMDMKWFGTRSNACSRSESTSLVDFTSFRVFFSSSSFKQSPASYVLHVGSASH